ncbi:hypothetical protein ACP4OV_001377 [Aristida adscensionis]
MPGQPPAMEGTVLCAANHAPLTPISFLESAPPPPPPPPPPPTTRRRHPICAARPSWPPAAAPRRAPGGTPGRAASAWPPPSLASASRATTWVAVFAQNIPAVCELHFAIRMAGAVICTLNSRLDAAMASALLQHSEAKVVFVDHALRHVAHDALRLVSKCGARPPRVVLIKELIDKSSPASNETLKRVIGDLELSSMSTRPSSAMAADRRTSPSSGPPTRTTLNYTSGTTSRLKGVVYSHRGAYLNSIAVVCREPATPVYHWTVPMFHSNGWCHVWGVAAKGGTNVCVRRVTAAAIFAGIARHGVTHMGGAPPVLNMIGPVTVKAGGAPPPPQVLLRLEALGFHVIHGYGLTETYGPASLCAWWPEWDALPTEHRARIKARQGLQLLGLEVDVKDPATMRSVPPDGRTMGEVMLRGNTVMRGYYKDAAATAEALAGGWLRSGDLAVRHGDGYVKIVDRSKDIAISGGENVSTIEVEAALSAHPAVAEAAVVGRPDEYWGETPCAFVTLRDGGEGPSAEDVMAFCRERLPRFIVLRTVLFVPELPKTATGKVKKVVLR